MEPLRARKGKIADKRDSIPIQEFPIQDDHLAVVKEEEEAHAIVKGHCHCHCHRRHSCCRRRRRGITIVHRQSPLHFSHPLSAFFLLFDS